MTENKKIHAIAKELHQMFCGAPWFRFVGIGSKDDRDVIFVYCCELPVGQVESYKGYELIYSQIDDPIPV